MNAVNLQPAAPRTDAVQAIVRITHVRLADLLNSSGSNARQQKALIDLLNNGGTVKARVLETRADGTSVVELGAARVTLRLPGTRVVGDWLLVSLQQDTVPAAADAGKSAVNEENADMPVDDKANAPGARVLQTRAGSAPLAGQVGAARLAAPTAAAALLTPVTLSNTAALLDDLKKVVLNKILTRTKGLQPLARPDATPVAMARTLQHAVRTSGLFYESHLADWVEGRLALDAIFEEPQARVADTPAPRSAIHPELQPLVRQQLDTFERQCIAWHGPLWPEQDVELVISREPQVVPEAATTWRVNLEMDTPTLGTLHIAVALSGRKLDVRLSGEPATTPAFCADREALSHALQAQGLEVNAIHVSSIIAESAA